jgi:hypothetical protein
MGRAVSELSAMELFAQGVKLENLKCLDFSKQLNTQLIGFKRFYYSDYQIRRRF